MKHHVELSLQGPSNDQDKWLHISIDKALANGFVNDGYLEGRDFKYIKGRVTDSQLEALRQIKQIEGIEKFFVNGDAGGDNPMPSYELNVKVAKMHGYAKVREKILKILRTFLAPGESLIKCNIIGQVTP
jgi:hypothetical protein